MDPNFPVKQEYPTGGSSSSGQRWDDPPPPPPPQPMEGLHEIGPPPFLIKTFDMVDDLSIDHIVSWSRGGHSFVVWDPYAFSNTVLPKYFKHSNFSSFVRQLNTYGFRKIDPDRWEFANESFLRGQRHLLRNIRRRKSINQPIIPPEQIVGPCVELGRFGVEAEVDRLRRDKHVLMTELVKLRQQQQNMRAYVQQMESRLEGTEKKQQQMMSFLAKAMRNPDFVQQLVRRKEIDEAVTKKRRRPIEAGETSRTTGVKAEPLEFGEPFGSQVSELEALALEMQGFGRAKREEIEELGEKELDAGFWDDLLNEGFDEESGMAKSGGEGEGEGEGEEEDVSVLADRIGFLGSNGPRLLLDVFMGGSWS